jgi:GNAT superfamily N-acetyltransferase
MSVTVRDAQAEDATAWRALWDGYCAFYRAHVPEEVSATTWARIVDPSMPLGCRLAARDGRVAGFAIHVIHLGTWTTAPICYLEDLFVDPTERGGGIGRTLIDDLLALCRTRGWGRLYWHTEQENATARRLYDRYAPADGFVRYRLFLEPPR